MVWMMCFEEAHQSVNLKENSSGRYLPLFKTNQREREREREREEREREREREERERERERRRGGGGFKAEQNQLPLRDGEGGLEGGLRRSLTVEPAFIRYIILLQLHTFIDISSSASHLSPAVMPAYSVSNKINTYTLGVRGKHSDSKLTVPTVCKALHSIQWRV